MKRAGRPERRRQNIVGGHIASTVQLFPPSVAPNTVTYDDPTTVVLINDVTNSVEVFHEDGSTEVHSLDGICSEDERPHQELRSEVRYVASFLHSLSGRLRATLAIRRSPARIHQPFGHNVYVVLEFLCSETTMKTIVNQTVADIREEENNALDSGRTAKVRWVHVRGYWTLLKALGFNGVTRLLAGVIAVWKSAS